MPYREGEIQISIIFCAAKIVNYFVEQILRTPKNLHFSSFFSTTTLFRYTYLSFCVHIPPIPNPRHTF